MATAPWTPICALHEDDDRFEAVLALVGTTWRTDRRDIAGAGLLADVLFAVLLRAATLALRDGAVPRLRADAIALRLHADGWTEEVTLGDVASAPLDDRASRTLVRDVEKLAEPLVERVHLVCGRPRAALWRHVGDALADGVLWAGEALGERATAQAWGDRVVALAPARWRAQTGYRVWRHGDLELPGRVRTQCCLHYRTDAGTACFGCPLKDEDHRSAWLVANTGGVA